MSGIRTIADLKDRCRVDEVTGCWIWSMCFTPKGQARVCINRKSMQGAKAAWLLSGGALQPGQIVYSKCRVRGCCNPAHMGAATRAELGALWSESGHLRGDPARAARSALQMRKRSTLTHADVLAIRSSELPNPELAAIYGVTSASIGAIRRGTRWRLAANASVFAWARAA